MTTLTGKAGFASARIERRSARCSAGVTLAATLALAVSLVVAATAVSIDVAHAEGIGVAAKDGVPPFVLAFCLGTVLAATGGLTALVGCDPRTPRGWSALAHGGDKSLRDCAR